MTWRPLDVATTGAARIAGYLGASLAEISVTPFALAALVSDPPQKLSAAEAPSRLHVGRLDQLMSMALGVHHNLLRYMGLESVRSQVLGQLLVYLVVPRLLFPEADLKVRGLPVRGDLGVSEKRLQCPADDSVREQHHANHHRDDDLQGKLNPTARKDED